MKPAGHAPPKTALNHSKVTRTGPATKGFDPRPDAGGDMTVFIVTTVLAVSIHASAWEATYDELDVEAPDGVSIRASAWEATNRLITHEKQRKKRAHSANASGRALSRPACFT